MNGNIQKNVLIGLFFTISNGFALAQDQEQLSQQCYDLGHHIESLVGSQAKKNCADYLISAALQTEAAGDSLVEEHLFAAKEELGAVIRSLKYAELNICNRYIQIAHAKYTAQKIKAFLQ